jgi:hypothetical protein
MSTMRTLISGRPQLAAGLLIILAVLIAACTNGQGGPGY